MELLINVYEYYIKKIQQLKITQITEQAHEFEKANKQKRATTIKRKGIKISNVISIAHILFPKTTIS